MPPNPEVRFSPQALLKKAFGTISAQRYQVDDLRMRMMPPPTSIKLATLVQTIQKGINIKSENPSSITYLGLIFI